MADRYLRLTEADRDAIRQVIADFRQRRSNMTGRPAVPEQDPTAPEVFVARTPEDGIPGSPDTGTSPGFAECELWQLETLNDGVSLRLQGIPDATRFVYNMSDADIAGDQFVLVIRDKHGTWWAVTGSAGTAESGQWVRLVGKHLQGADSPIYDWWHVHDHVLEARAFSGTGTATSNLFIGAAHLFWSRGAESGGQHGTPLLEVNTVDLPVEDPAMDFHVSGTGTSGYFDSESIVFAVQGAGDYKLFVQQPRWEHIVKTGPVFQNPADGKFYHTGDLLYYDQTEKQMCVKKNILVRAVKCLAIVDNCCAETA